MPHAPTRAALVAARPRASPPPASRMITILRNADLYIPESVGQQSLLVGGGRVLWMGDDLPALDPMLIEEEIDLQGARVIPGLVDGHAHTTGGGGEVMASTVMVTPLLAIADWKAAAEARIPPEPVSVVVSDVTAAASSTKISISSLTDAAVTLRLT